MSVCVCVCLDADVPYATMKMLFPLFSISPSPILHYTLASPPIPHPLHCDAGSWDPREQVEAGLQAGCVCDGALCRVPLLLHPDRVQHLHLRQPAHVLGGAIEVWRVTWTGGCRRQQQYPGAHPGSFHSLPPPPLPLPPSLLPLHVSIWNSPTLGLPTWQPLLGTNINKNNKQKQNRNRGAFTIFFSSSLRDIFFLCYWPKLRLFATQWTSDAAGRGTFWDDEQAFRLFFRGSVLESCLQRSL